MLSRVADEGHEEAVKLLVEQHDVEANLKIKFVGACCR
jgi:hypothetical protein